MEEEEEEENQPYTSTGISTYSGTEINCKNYNHAEVRNLLLQSIDDKLRYVLGLNSNVDAHR